jgi:hypothetical protein
MALDQARARAEENMQYSSEQIVYREQSRTRQPPTSTIRNPLAVRPSVIKNSQVSTKEATPLRPRSLRSKSGFITNQNDGDSKISRNRISVAPNKFEDMSFSQAFTSPRPTIPEQLPPSTYNPLFINSQGPTLLSSHNLSGNRNTNSVSDLGGKTASPLKKPGQRSSVAPRNPLQTSFKSHREENRGSIAPDYQNSITQNSFIDPFTTTSQPLTNYQPAPTSYRGGGVTYGQNLGSSIEPVAQTNGQNSRINYEPPSNILKRFSYKGFGAESQGHQRYQTQGESSSEAYNNPFQRQAHRVTSNSNIYSLINKNY